MQVMMFHKKLLVINNKLLVNNVIGYKFNLLVISILVSHHYVYNLAQAPIIVMDLKSNPNCVFCFQIINVFHVMKLMILVLVWIWETIVFITLVVDVNQIYANIWINLNVSYQAIDVIMIITLANNCVLNYRWNNANKETLIAIGIPTLKCVKKELKKLFPLILYQMLSM